MLLWTAILHKQTPIQRYKELKKYLCQRRILDHVDACGSDRERCQQRGAFPDQRFRGQAIPRITKSIELMTKATLVLVVI